jgi:hypothetical protein
MKLSQTQGGNTDDGRDKNIKKINDQNRIPWKEYY